MSRSTRPRKRTRPGSARASAPSRRNRKPEPDPASIRPGSTAASRSRLLIPAFLGVMAVSFWAGLESGRRLASTAAPNPLPNPIASVEPAAAVAPAPTSRPAAPPPAEPFQAAMAGEFHRQSGVLLGCAEMVRDHPEVFLDIVSNLRGHVPILALVGCADDRQAAEELLRENDLDDADVRFIQAPVSTMWARDYGPQFIRTATGTTEVLDTLSPLPGDDLPDSIDFSAPGAVARRLFLPICSTEFRVEGGNLLTNGDGLCVTTSAFLDENGEIDEPRIRTLLRDSLGCDRWACLEPLQGESTGHVDMFVTFVAENAAVVAECDPRSDPANAAILDAAAAALAGIPTSKGPVRVHRIPMPPAEDGVFRSYTNVIYANGILLLPTYSGVDPEIEQKAFDVYARLLPGWRIVGINCDSLIQLGGALHCVTMNVPSFVPLRGRVAARPAALQPARVIR